VIAPSQAHDQWDRLIVGGKVAPGIVRLSGDGLKIGWDWRWPKRLVGVGLLGGFLMWRNP
jgi:hypothetical protein